MARQMVTRFGMSDVIGLMAIGHADQEVFLGRDMVQRREISEHTAQQVDQEIKRVLDEAQERARSILADHTDLLERIAQALLERETLDVTDIGLLDAGEELPPLPAANGEAEEGSADPEGGSANGEKPEADTGADVDADPDEADPDELDATSADEVKTQTDVPAAVKLGEEPSGNEETSSGTVRTPAVQLSAEDPEADASG